MITRSRSLSDTSATRRSTVSAVIPCYNYGSYLPAAVESVLTQHGVGLDVIIVDDASTDGSQEIARSLAASDPRVRLIIHEVNAGHIATYNDGLARATGDYVVLLSADDLLAPGSLLRAVSLMNAHPEVALVYGYAPPFHEVPPIVERQRTAREQRWSGVEWVHGVCRRGHNAVTNPEVLIRRSVMDALGGYAANLPHTADMDLWLRAATLGSIGRVSGPPQAYYRIHGGNMHLTDFSGLLTDMRARRETFDLFFNGDGRMLPDAEWMRQTAHRAIATHAMRDALLAIGERQPDGGAAAEELAAFAVDTWPHVVQDRRWRLYQERMKTPAPRLVHHLEKSYDGVRSMVRWRRWRRYGL